MKKYALLKIAALFCVTCLVCTLAACGRTPAPSVGTSTPAPSDIEPRTEVTSGYCGANGDELSWTLWSNGELVITGNGAMHEYLSNPAPWRNSSESIRTATIGSGVTSIGDYAFKECASLTSVTIPASVSFIGHHAFQNCSALTSVTIPAGVTELGVAPFASCTSLTDIHVVDGNPAYTSVDGVLLTGDGRTVVACPGGKAGAYTIPAGVTSIGNCAFTSCTSLTDVTIPEGVTVIGDEAFSYCSSLVSVTIPESVTSIGTWAFWTCSALTSVTVPAGVTRIGTLAFDRCTSLTEVSIREGVTVIGDGAFRSCTALTSVTIPASVTSIEQLAFYSCPSLSDLTYAGTQAQWAGISIGDDNDALSAVRFLR